MDQLDADPDFAPGPKFHKEPAAGIRRWEEYIEQQGLFRLPDGRFQQKDSHLSGDGDWSRTEGEKRDRTE